MPFSAVGAQDARALLRDENQLFSFQGTKREPFDAHMGTPESVKFLSGLNQDYVRVFGLATRWGAPKKTVAAGVLAYFGM